MQIRKEERDQITKIFRAQLARGVRVLLFTSKRGCLYCAQTRELLEDVASLTDKIKLEVLDIDEERSKAEEMAAELAPTTVVIGDNGARLHYVGMPAGRQLGCLVEDIIDASRGYSDLDEEVKNAIRRVNTGTTIKVFVTPSCLYSPLVVRSAHKFALENTAIRGMMIESVEFPELARKYGVVGVPRTIINESFAFDGAPADKVFAEKVLEASMRSA